MRLSRAARAELRTALEGAAPWVHHPDAGPRAVDAGQCDRCGDHPRLLPTCGPVPWRALCRGCGLDVGRSGWCDGHAPLAEELLAWAQDLPPWWGEAVVLWWVATGEIGTVPPQVAPGLPAEVRAALPAP